MEQQLSFKLLAKNKCLYWNLMQNSRRWSFARAFSHLHSAIPPCTKSTDLSLRCKGGVCGADVECRTTRRSSRVETKNSPGKSHHRNVVSCCLVQENFSWILWGIRRKATRNAFSTHGGKKRESSFEHSEMEETRHEIVTNSLKFSFWPDLLFLIF